MSDSHKKGPEHYFGFRQQGGNDSFGVHCPTKTAPLECDIRGGLSLDVPAMITCDILDVVHHRCCNRYESILDGWG